MARDLRLQGFTLDEKGSEQGEIEIMVGDSPGPHVSHVIKTPARVSILETEDGEPRTLLIEADGEPTTLVHFRPFADTEILDGTFGEEDEDE